MVKADRNVLKYIDGFAVHWYWDFMIGVGVINKLNNKHPDKFILYTEACLGKKKILYTFIIKKLSSCSST